MGAITLDGKATRDEIFVDLKERVAALTASGRTPGLGTILVGDDPGSQAYVAGKHRDCAQVGIASIRRDLPAPTVERGASSGAVDDAALRLPSLYLNLRRWRVYERYLTPSRSVTLLR